MKKFIGKTDVSVKRLGFGGAGIAGLYTKVQESEALAAVHEALRLGFDFFDCAPEYGHGRAELSIGEGLKGQARESFVLSTKVGKLLIPEDPARVTSPEFCEPLPYRLRFDYSFAGVIRSVEESLRRLNLNRVDLLHIHDPDDHYAQAIAGAYPALIELKRQGVTRAIGAGMNQADMLVRFAQEGDFDCFILAGRYTLLDPTGLKRLLPLCVEKDISVIIGAPYNSGILATGAVAGAKYDYTAAAPKILERVRSLEKVCARFDVPLRAAALQFPLAHPAVVSIIPGARSAQEVRENVELVNSAIPAEFWEQLRNEKLIPEDAPVPRGGR